MVVICTRYERYELQALAKKEMRCMRLGYAYREALTLGQREALYSAAEMMEEGILDDLAAFHNGSWEAEYSVTVSGLPQRYLLRYTPQFIRRFDMCLLTVIWKLGQRQRILLSCVAEELAAYSLIQVATGILETTDEETDFNAFKELLFEDIDFELLYDNAFDGIEETQLAEKLGIANLAFADWFTSFGSPGSDTYPEPHPLAWDNTATSTDEPDEDNELDERDEGGED